MGFFRSALLACPYLFLETDGMEGFDLNGGRLKSSGLRPDRSSVSESSSSADLPSAENGLPMRLPWCKGEGRGVAVFDETVERFLWCLEEMVFLNDAKMVVLLLPIERGVGLATGC